MPSAKNADSFEYKDVTYEVEKEGEDLYLISSNGTVLAIAAKDIVNAADGAEASALTFAVKHEALKAYANGEASFTADGQDYTMDADGNILSGGDRARLCQPFRCTGKGKRRCHQP